MSEMFVVKVKMLLQVSPHRPISVYDKINNLNLRPLQGQVKTCRFAWKWFRWNSKIIIYSKEMRKNKLKI